MTRDDIIRMAREAGAPDWWIGLALDGSRSGPALRWLESVVSAAVAAEREACARVCEGIARDAYGMTELREYGECAAAIRARGAK